MDRDSLVNRIIELREGVNSPSFASIADTISHEWSNDITKDQVQKIYQKLRPVKSRKIVAIGDLHGNPDHDLIDMVIDEKPDKVIIGGDLLHGAEFSRHLPSYSEVIDTIEQEEARVIKALLRLDCPIDLMTGNHDENIRKRILETIPTQARRYVTVKDPFENIAKMVPDCTTIDTSVRAHYPDNSSAELGSTRFMLPVGDLLISHFNFTGVKAMDKLLKFAFDWGDYLAWPRFKVLVQFHTHRLSWTEQLGGHRILIEPGMTGLPITEGYKVQFEPKWQPGIIGGLVFEQKVSGSDWKTDLSSLRLLRPHRA